MKSSGVSLVQDRRKRLLRRLGLEAAQHVIGPELDDQRVGVRRHGPVISRQPVCGRIAGHPGVEDIHVQTPGAKRRLQTIREGLAGRQAEAGGQAVSEDDEANRPGLARRSCRENDRECDRLDEEEPMPI
jgi:hypothetical protein